MHDGGGHWRPIEQDRIEVCARLALQDEWYDRGARDRRAGLPFEDAAKVKVKSYRRAWKNGWKAEDVIMGGSSRV